MKLFCILLFGAVLAVMPVQGHADRLYTWTDDQGVSHITKHPPPADAKRKDVLEYSHKIHEEQQAAAATREKEKELQRKAGQVLTEESGNVEQYREEIREDLTKQAAEGKNTCYLQAPDRRVYVRVFSTNSYNEREKEIWDGWIEPNQQALVISPTEQIIYNRKWEENGPFDGDNLRTCSGGGFIQIPGI